MIMGFDLTPGSLYNPAQSVFPFAPLNGAGIEPFLTQYGITNQQASGAANVYSCIGTTGRAQDKFAHGANALVMYSYSSAYTPNLAFSGAGKPMSVTAAFRYTIGFRIKIDAGSPATMVGLVSLLTVNGTVCMTLGTDYKLSVMGAATTVTLVRGTEYYIELTFDYPTPAASGNYTPNVSLAVDGIDVITRPGPTWSSALTFQWNLGFVTRAGSGATQSSVRILFGDFYMTDLAGDAPYNGRLGPQRVKAVYPDEVVDNTWGMSEGSDPLALIGQGAANDDTKYITAPDDESGSTYHFGLPTNPRSLINGMVIYARAKREDAASRKLTVEVAKGDGTVLWSPAGTSLTTAFAHHPITQVMPATAADVVDLKDSVLQNATFSLKAPLT